MWEVSAGAAAVQGLQGLTFRAVNVAMSAFHVATNSRQISPAASFEFGLFSCMKWSFLLGSKVQTTEEQ